MLAGEQDLPEVGVLQGAKTPTLGCRVMLF
jgi:hypothetical protein